jgi:hypothetical protein
MHWQAREIRWTNSALDYFIDELTPTPKDFDAIKTLLVAIRDTPDEEGIRLPVDKDSQPALAGVHGDVYVSYASQWEVYYAWLPDEIVVLHVEAIRK